MKRFVYAAIFFATVALPSYALGQSVEVEVQSPPREVRELVIKQKRPSVSVESEITVGTALPDTIEVYPVEGHTTYSYTIVNDRRVIVDPGTRKVIEVID